MPYTPIDNIPRFNASVDGETVFLKDTPKGTLVNATMLISAVQRRLSKLREDAQNEREDVIVRMQIKGRIWALEELLNALGEEPL